MFAGKNVAKGNPYSLLVGMHMVEPVEISVEVSQKSGKDQPLAHLFNF